MNAEPNPPSTRPLARDVMTEFSHFKPRLNQLLRSLRLDVIYERGEGNYLYGRDRHGAEVEVLDLVGGFGSLLLGHAHPALVAEAQRLLAGGRPMHAQGSTREYAARLAAELSQRVRGNYCVIFGNSGAEAVEAAMKHALLETGGRTFIALERAFHGKTLGAVQLTANPEYRESFHLPGLNILRVPLNHVEQLEAAFSHAVDLAGFIFEPVVGEGGVRLVEPEFVRRAARLCAERGVPLIADECQTGMGRTGTFLASEQLGVQPDYIVLSKSLGGGIAKISAALIRRDRYMGEFDLKHTSTFADDDFSCALALKTLELIDEELLARCGEQGDKLMFKLRMLAQRYPEAIVEVRGRGLMIGLEFRRPAQSRSFVLRYLGSQEDLVCMVMGYLLNVHRIRVAPTLSDRFTLRLEPSALLTDNEIERTVVAIEDVCHRLSGADAPGLTRFLSEGGEDVPRGEPLIRSDARFVAYDEPYFRLREKRPPPARVGWLCHLIDSGDLNKLEPAFGELDLERRETFLARLVPRMAPIVMGASDVRSMSGDTVRFHPILLPFTSRWVKRQIEAGQLNVPRALVQMGVDLARSLDCQMVSLGQYTSIVTHNGLRLDSGGAGVTTGNSYSVALAIQAITRALAERATNPKDSVLVIVGAGGNIGRTCAAILAPRYRRTILVGSGKPGAERRLQEFAGGIPNASVTTDLTTIAEGQVVVAALNAVDAPLTSRHFGQDAVVCDLSVPAGLTAGLEANRPDLLIIKGGIASLPCGEDLEIVGFPLPSGQVYGCMAEAMLLGFEGVGDSTFTGSLTKNHVCRVAEMAKRHGFQLAEFKRFCVFGPATAEETHAINF